MKKLLAGIALFGMALPAHAATIIYNAQNLVGNSSFSGTRGLNFQVNTPVRVTALGVFDSGSNGITKSLGVGIFDAGENLDPGNLLTSLQIGPSAANGTNFIFQQLDGGLVLQPGLYQLASWGYDADNPSFDNGGSGGPIAFDDLGGLLSARDSSFNFVEATFARL